jgi:TRAP-type C4-dicarboxylate transport system substrate-binding protein
MKEEQMKENRSLKIFTPTALLILILLLALVAGGVSCGSGSSTTASPTKTAEKPITLVFSLFEPALAMSWVDFYKPWFEDIEKRAGGKIKIEAHLGGELLSLPDTYNGIVQGTVDMGHVFPSMVQGKFTMSEIVNFWSYDKNIANKGRICWDLFKSVPEALKQYDETKLIWFGSSYNAGLGTTKKPLVTLEDLKGTKITTTGAWCAARQELLGIVPVALPPEAMVTSMQTGIIDGMSAPAWGLRDMGWGAVMKYMTLVNIYDGGYAFMINQNTWNKLPADIQKIFIDTGEEWIDKFDELNVRVGKERLASAPQEFGMQVIELSKEEQARWAAADKPAIQKFAADLESKGLPGNKFISEFLKLEDKYNLPANPLR